MTRIGPIVGVVAFASLAFSGSAPAQELQGTGRIDGGSGESLSSKLSRSDGVIKPKSDVDPAIHVPAPVPQPNSTPVIPPAATGGNTAK